MGFLKLDISSVISLSFHIQLKHSETSHWNFRQFPLYFSTVVYALGGFNGVLANESTLTDPKQVLKKIQL